MPTYGRVSRRGVVPLAFSLDHIGPMTRTVRDNALRLQVIADHDPGDPGSVDEPVPGYSAMLGEAVRGLRIGVVRHFYTRDVIGNPEQVEALDAAVKLFAGAGAETSEITLPALQDFSACGQIILAAEAYAVHEQWLKERPALVQQLVDHELTETALQHLFVEPGQRADRVVGKLASENRAQGDGFSGGTRTIY